MTTVPSTAASAASAAFTPTATAGPILVATPGDAGAAAVETARRLAARDGRAIAVVSAVELPQVSLSPAGVPYVSDVDEYVEAQRARVAHALATAGPETAAWPVELTVDEPSRAIARAAAEGRASLVVVGSGRHDIAARVFGEVALRVVRRAPCPVLVIGSEPMVVPPRVAVAAVDFSPSSVVAARGALDLLGPGGTLHLVHVWSRHVIDSPTLLAADEQYERSIPERFARVERELLDQARDVTILPTSLLGDPVEQLVAFARSHRADVLAAGRQGHGLLELLFVGRVTTALLRDAPCAVLVTQQPSLAVRDALQRAVAGTSESRSHDEWAALLAAFSGRNAGRRTRLEVDDPSLGAQTQETGYTLLGAAYDHHDHRATLMLGHPDASTTHLTRSVTGVTSVAVHTADDGQDVALRLTHGTTQTLLTLLPPSSA